MTNEEIVAEGITCKRSVGGTWSVWVCGGWASGHAGRKPAEEDAIELRLLVLPLLEKAREEGASEATRVNLPGAQGPSREGSP